MPKYDYLIVGAGSAGCVLANRLSENPNTSVCLIEAGGGDWSPFIHIPAGWASNFNNPRVDWGYHTAPEMELNERKIFWPRGKVLGGSSAINGMIYIRGVPLDFAAWEQAGATGWSWEEVLPYFKKSEKQQTHHDDMHGEGGPLFVEDVRDKRPVHEVYLDAMESVGMPRNADFNGKDQAGAGYYQFTQHNGRRWSASTAYLSPVKQRKNLTIISSAKAEKILFEGKTANAIQIRRKESVDILYGQHIVLSGGSINSPQLLELSGIGDGERLHALGIPLVHSNPDVGEHLQDHLLSKVVYGTLPEQSINREVQGLRLVPTVLNWFLRRRGALTTGSAPVGGFWYTREGLEAPDIQIHFASGATLYNNQGKIEPLKIPAMTAVVNQSRPESRGSVHIRTAEANDTPEIHANYLSADLDRQTIIRGVRLLLDIFSAEPLQDQLTGRLSPDANIDTTSDEELLEYIREDASTVYHPTSTCSIGKVVNEDLFVKGVSGLTIADASVMPYVVSGNTNAATIMIGEKASDILKNSPDTP